MTEDFGASDIPTQLSALLNGAEHSADMAKAFLAEFAASKGISEGLLDDGMLMAEAEGMEMMLVPLPDRPMVLATVELKADLGEEPELARAFLEANLDWTATGGGTFASLGEDETPHLCRLIFVQPGAVEAFTEEIAGVFEVARAWLEALDDDEPDFEPEEDAAAQKWMKA